MHYYDVAPLKLVRAEANVFTYASDSQITPGQLVTIPVGKSSLTGLVIRSTKKPAFDAKPIEQALDIPPLPQALIETALWMSDYYATHLSTVLQTVLPRGITKKRRPRIATNTPVTRKRTNIVFNDRSIRCTRGDSCHG